MQRRKVKKSAVFLATLVLIISVFFTVSLVRKSFSAKEELAYKESDTFVYKGKENIQFIVDYTNDKKLNKALETSIEHIYEENKDVFDKKDKDIFAKLSLNKEKNLASWLFSEESENVGEVYGTLVFNTESNEVIPVEKIYGDKLEGLSMLVRNNLAKDENLLYNRNIYSKTLPELKNYKNIIFDNDGLSILFKRDLFEVGAVKAAKLTYKEVMPYLSDEFLTFFQEDYIKPETNDRYIDPQKPMVAMTFDDGPNYDKTKDLADHFAANNGRATYFMLGSRIENDPDLVLYLHNNGHEIANHSYNHKNFTKINDEELAFQTDGVNKIIKELTQQEKILMRTPYGSSNGHVRSKVSNPLILWEVDPEDWKYRDKAIVYNNMKNHMYDGAIILLHDLYETSTAAAKQLIDNYKDDYQFVTVSEMFAYKGIPLVNGELYFSARGR